jgi:hypothetical protein
MANRGYLMATHSPHESRVTFINDDDRRYYDSRHYFPLAWLFFFRAPELNFEYEEGYGSEVRFVAKRHEACDYFMKKRSLLEKIVNHTDAIPLLDKLVTTIRSWARGEYLVLSAYEVWQNEDEELEEMQAVLSAIAKENASYEEILECLNKTTAPVYTNFYVPEFDDFDVLERDLIGWTYWEN